MIAEWATLAASVSPTWAGVAGGVAVALIGGLTTNLTPWYRALRVPSWKPPDWAFGPIWTVIIALSTYAGIRFWNATEDPVQRWTMVAAFTVNGILNVLWSVLFFRLRRPDWALVEVVPLWLSIAVIIAILAPVDTVGALLVAPYLVWVTIATILNRAIVRLNAPFGAAAAGAQ